MKSPSELEVLFGAPDDPANPTGHRAIVAADARNCLVEEAEELLDSWGFFEEFVPQSRGGRWQSTENLVRRLLPIFRRDPALGLGHGVTSLMAGNVAWVGGNEAARHRVAARLLAGERIAIALTEFDHGNDLLRNEFTAESVDDGTAWAMAGRKEIISNLHRARSVVVLARTEDRNDLRSLTLIDWQKTDEHEQVDTSTRTWTSGMRGVPVGAADLTGVQIPFDHTIGPRGAGADTVLKAFQISRTVLPALATGTVDAALRLAADFMSSRELYGSDLWELPHARQLIARAWGSLLVADSLARTAVRALHLRPEECFLISAATKYLVPYLLNDAMLDLTTLLGSTFYALDSPFAVIEKWMRDLIVLPIGHAGTVSCLLALIPNLPAWERRTRTPAVFDPVMFGLDPLEGELDFGRFRVGAGSSDSLTSALSAPPVIAAFHAAFPEHSSDLDSWIDELRSLQSACHTLRPNELGTDAQPKVADLAIRLTHMLATGALVGRWYATRSQAESAFARSGGALRAAAARLSELINTSASSTREFVWTDDVVAAATEHLRCCVRDRRSLGVEEMPITWTGAMRQEEKQKGTT